MRAPETAKDAFMTCDVGRAGAYRPSEALD
jgi:hypothetical protein